MKDRLREALKSITDGPMSRECCHCNKTTRYSNKPKINNHREDCPVAIAEAALASQPSDLRAKLEALRDEMKAMAKEASRFDHAVAGERERLCKDIHKRLTAIIEGKD